MTDSSCSRRASALPARVALCQARLAELSQPALGVGVLGPGVAVAEVACEVERQALRQRQRLAHRLRVVGEARRHRLWRRKDVALVAAALGLAGLERRAVADRHEGVL